MKTHIPAGHPALPGHFPGQPIVPGAVLLERVLSALNKLVPGARVTGLPSAKFLAPLRPDETVEITVTPKANGSASFEVLRGEVLVVSGSLRYQAG